MKVNTWHILVNNSQSQGDVKREYIQISDDGDHVGTVQYSLTESSCFEVSNL